MLAKPLVSVLDAPNIWSMTVALRAWAWVVCWDLAQKFWSCCQNEPLPILVIESTASHETPLLMTRRG
jgi:hypothetical protein